MPSLTTYSPYETLVFFQHVAHYGIDKSSLQEISSTLNENQFIRESSGYDAAKFSADALQSLFDRTLNSQAGRANENVNGIVPTEPGNPLKRKLSTTPLPNPNDEPEQSVQRLVDELYARFKAETIRELRQQESEYEELQRKISTLEAQVKTAKAEQSQAVKDEFTKTERTSLAKVQEDNADPDNAQPRANLASLKGIPNESQSTENRPASVPLVQDRVQPSPVPVQAADSRAASRSATPNASIKQVQGLPHILSHPSPSALNRNLPQPSSQRSNYGPIPPPPHAYPPHPTHGQHQPPMLPSIHALQRMPSHEGYSPQHQPSSQGRDSPMPQHVSYAQQNYPGYPPYQHPPPHGWPSPSPQPYPQSYAPQQHYPPPPPVRYPQTHTPNQPMYAQHPNTAPVPYPANLQSQGSAMLPHQQYPASANTTPAPTRPQSRATSVRSASSTPWKRKSLPLGFRPRSPTRLDREISPLSDHESSPLKSFKQDSEEENSQKESRGAKSSDRKTDSIHRLSPSRSIVSNTSEVAEPAKRRPGRPPKIKHEQPSTPLPAASDADSEQQQRSSGRRGRPRAGTNNAPPSELLRTTTATKRKRDAPSSSPTSRARSSSNAQPSNGRGLSHFSNPKFVVASKTFGRTSQLLLNEIMSHKLAGIFAKALTERDAPGYKDLVHRAQDLKSIRAAISKGSRAAILLIEALEGTLSEDAEQDNMDLDSSEVTNRNVELKEGPIGNGFFLLHVTEDICPPKGIVNSAQLETELVRMFANAIMFNPLPSSERGFGRLLRLRKRGGELKAYGAQRQHKAEFEHENGTEDNESTAEASDETESTTPSSTDETGIIADARDMFRDVEDMVARWRELEGEHAPRQLSISGPAGLDRHPSVSASSLAGEEDESAAGMSTRKRRRLGDH